MDNEPIAIFEHQVEAKRINVLLERNMEELGDFEFVPVGNIGYILQSERQKPMAGNDWILFDYDDTLVAYTEVKEKRLDLYRAYLEKLGIELTEEQVSKTMEMTDKFSRWEEKEGEGKLYHANSHMAALQWATKTFRESQVDTDETITNLHTKLNRIKAQLVDDQQSQEADPFYFEPNHKRLILRGADRMWSKDIEEIFVQTVINPPQYPEIIEAAKDIGSPRTSIHRTNIGIFTYGDPYFQLTKVFELMKQNPDLPISQIWLTRGPKGDFIVEAVMTNATSKFTQDYVPAELEEYEGEELSYGSGYVLGQSEHVVVMMDDNPKELSSILAANDYLNEKTKSSFVVVRSKRAGTKAQNREWQVNTPYGELDFTSRSFLPKDISNTFLINRYLHVRAKLGEQHPNTRRLQNELKFRGVTDL